MRCINIIVFIFIVFTAQFMINIETAFESGIIMIVTSLVMIVLNTMESRKLYKEQNTEKYFRINCIIFIWLIIAIIAVLLIFNSTLYSELINNLEKIRIK